MERQYNMETLNYSETNPFFGIPQKKINNAIEDIYNVHLNPKTGKITTDGAKLLEVIHRYASANIPVDYWFREMDKFEGDDSLVRSYKEMTASIKKSYDDGKNYCFAGAHGRGKTMTACCMLKRVVETGKYNALYVNLTDIVNLMASYSSEDREVKSAARKLLLSVDFLVIDEFDSRFMGTDNATDLFGRMLEPVLRSRIQNKLPTIFCTNNTEPDSLFNGALKQSFKSLMQRVKTVNILGTDFRKK